MNFNNINYGNQTKFCENNIFYKIDTNGCHEAIAEELASFVLLCSTLDKKEYVSYWHFVSNNKHLCGSKNFLSQNEEIVTIDWLYKNNTKSNILLKTRNMRIPEAAEYVIKFVKDNTNLDIRNYLAKCLTLDKIVLNTDRHYKNLAVKINKDTGTYCIAPIFDNGNGLFSTKSFHPYDDKTIETEKKYLGFKPFDERNFDIDAMCDYFGVGFKVDFNLLNEILDIKYKNLAESDYGFKELTVLKHQIELFKISELNVEFILDDKIRVLKELKNEYNIDGTALINNKEER